MTAQHAAPRAASNSGNKYLTFYIGAEEYGVAILKVREIIGVLDVTRVPGTAEHIQGVVNLRGRIIPVINLRARLKMPTQEPTAESCIVVVQREGGESGLVVDRVAEVCDLPAAEIGPMLELGSGIPAEYFIGVSRANNRVRLLLDVGRVLSTSTGAPEEDAP